MAKSKTMTCSEAVALIGSNDAFFVVELRRHLKAIEIIQTQEENKTLFACEVYMQEHYAMVRKRRKMRTGR